MNTFEFEVPAMTCGGCARKITNAVKACAPEAVLEIDIAARQVKIEAQAPRAAIEAAIREAGYGFEPARANAES